MSLTYKQIWEQYSHVEFKRRIYVKRLNTDGTYESEFTEISQAQTKDGSVKSLTRSLPNDSYQFGYVTVNNVNLEILSAFQEFASELDPNSIFKGYIRHKSIIKIVDAFIDKYTDPDNPVEASITSFEGLIDATTAQTEQGYEKVTILDYMTVLDDVNVSELTLTEATMNDLIYEIMNRASFTKFFNVSASTDYINAGYNATDIDVTEYSDSTVLEMMQDLAKGHSIFYIDPDDGYFYFRPADPTASIQHEFLEANNRKLSISAYREGLDKQVTNWYWQDIEEFLSEDGDDWTSTGWDGSSLTWTHETGNTSVLSESTPAESGRKYKITYTVTDRTAGTFSIAFGGNTETGLYESGVIEMTSSSTGNLQITPTSDFDGTIKISIKPVIEAISSEDTVNPISETFKIDGIKNNTQRQALLDYIITRTQEAKPYFTLQLPYFPVIKLLDRVTIQSFGSAPRDAVRWGMFKWTDSATGDPNTAPRWRKPAGIRISADEEWMVIGISHDSNLKTKVSVQKIL